MISIPEPFHDVTIFVLLCLEIQLDLPIEVTKEEGEGEIDLLGSLSHAY